jgi:hypothetical protein
MKNRFREDLNIGMVLHPIDQMLSTKKPRLPEVISNCDKPFVAVQCFWAIRGGDISAKCLLICNVRDY